MMGCIAVDRQANPLRKAIIWADTRASVQAEALVAQVGMLAAYRITGHRASPSYTAAKIMWLRQNQPDVFSRTYKFLQVKDFIVARLTGCFVSDYSDASGTNLYDLGDHAWSPLMLAASGLSPALLPELHPSTDVVGQVTQQPAAALGLLAGTPVVIGGGMEPALQPGPGWWAKVGPTTILARLPGLAP